MGASDGAADRGPVITPTLQTGTAAIVVAACAWLGSRAGSVSTPSLP
ncbi:hypothetical protein SAMN04487915_101775 [Arthrobacter sp. ov118]|nr:hypothetical protein SAMN04487915_101775 [Arthrobacter sp. ov118]